MKLDQLKPPKNSKRPRKRVGRGEGSGMGKTCGRGHKGQKSRSGVSIPAWFEGGQMPLIRRIPKRGPKRTAHVRIEYVPINVGNLNRFDDGSIISIAELRDAGFVSGRNAKIKILGDGELEKKLTIKADKFSKTAIRKIEALGGIAEVV